MIAALKRDDRHWQRAKRGVLMLKAIATGIAVEANPEDVRGHAVLDHQGRHLRRCRIDLAGGERLLVDLPETVALRDGDILLLEGGGHIDIIAADEPLYAVTARDRLHLLELAWHIGNRHLPAEIRDGEILILRDHVIRAMLLGLGAQVEEVVAPFSPVRGAYSGHGTGAHRHDAAEAEAPPPQYHLNHSSPTPRN
jgi:urease accessory protein